MLISDWSSDVCSSDLAGVRLMVDGDAQVQANPRLLRRAIANLVSNAIKATPNGQTIRARCAQDEQFVELRLRNQGLPINSEERRVGNECVITVRSRLSQSTVTKKQKSSTSTRP